MAGKRLATYVYVPNKDGVMVAFGPDDDVPAWAAKALADNPLVWAADDVEVADEPAAEGDQG